MYFSSNEIFYLYNPGRICVAAQPALGHLRMPEFCDEELEMPKPPSKPRPPKVSTWMPVWATFVFTVVSFFQPPVLFFLIPIWVAAIQVRRPEYLRKKYLLDLKYQEELTLYRTNKDYYKKVVLTNWREIQRPRVLKAKQDEWKKGSIEMVCRIKGWRPNCDEEIEESREKKFIGIGENALIKALSRTGIFSKHQVQIEPYYTADIVCFNPDSGKLCVVEVDGSQHWLNEKNIVRDN